MSRFAIRTPYLIIVICLVVVLVGIVAVARMPVDLFPAMNIPVVAVATFYPGMPPEQIEGNITSTSSASSRWPAASNIWSRGRSPASA